MTTVAVLPPPPPPPMANFNKKAFLAAFRSSDLQVVDNDKDRKFQVENCSAQILIENIDFERVKHLHRIQSFV